MELILGLLFFAILFGIISFIINTLEKIGSFFKGSNDNKKQSEPLPKPVTLPKVVSTPKPIAIQKHPYSDKREEWVRLQLNQFDETPSVVDLLNKEISSIGYADLLSCFEWKTKRLKVLVRDKYRCQDCRARNISNHVHHTYYLKNKLPWDIDLVALLTLCNTCHSQRHKKEKIKVYEIVMGKMREAQFHELFCSRCNGSGYLPEFSHVQNGICFKCHGSSINKGVFDTVLKNIKHYPLSYSISQQRQDYQQYLRSISVQQYEQDIHFENSSMFRYTSTNSVDDDLPF